MKNNIVKDIKSASFSLVNKTEKERNRFLTYLARLVWEKRKQVILANKKDLANAKATNIPKSLRERLVLDEKGITNMVVKLHDLQKLKSLLGETIEQRKIEKNAFIKKIRTSIGVIGVIYESRPDVTTEIVALCIKSGNAVVLKGGSEAFLTNNVIQKCVEEALKRSGIQRSAVTFIPSREEMNAFLKEDTLFDLVIARGGYAMVKSVVRLSKAPVLAHSAGGARIYIDESADLEIAETVILNAKLTKPAACNSVDSVLVHKSLAKTKFLSTLIKRLQMSGVEILGDAETVKLTGVKKARKSDWGREFLDFRMTARVVSGVSEAIDFINTYTKKHSEGIIAGDKKVIRKFSREIDTAAVFINCSTRLHDGYIFGLGSEMGIATGKLHARGPVGLKELTTYKWEVYGNGQIRE